MTTINPSLDGDVVLREFLQRHGINLCVFIAEMAVWANPAVFKILKAENGLGVWYPNVRRAKRGERKGQFVDGVRLDDNTYSNFAIEGAIGNRQTQNVDTCHIWPLSAYDERYYTCIANIILIPCCVARLTDHYAPAIDALKYRAFELYGWYPTDIGGQVERPPSQPSGYPKHWREPEPITSEIELMIRRRKTR